MHALVVIAITSFVFRQNRFCSASDSAAHSYIFPYRGLSIICPSHSSILFKPFADLDVIWQVHSGGIQWHTAYVKYIVFPWIPGEGRVKGSKLEVWNPPVKTCNCTLQPNRICYHLANTNEKYGVLATTIPSSTKLLWWSLFSYHLLCQFVL